MVTVEPARIPKLQDAPAAIGPGQAIGVKVQTKSAAIATPVSLRTPVVTVAVYIVPTTRGADGVKVKVVFVVSAVIAPDTFGETVKVPVFTVAGFIVLLNVALTNVVGQAV